MLETLDYTIRIGSTPTFFYFDLYRYLRFLKNGPLIKLIHFWAKFELTINNFYWIGNFF